MSRAALAVDMTDTDYFAHDRLSDADFAQLAAIISSHVGIKLPPAKRMMVEGRLRKRVRHLGFPGLSEYCRRLFYGHGFEEEFIHLIDAVTTNKTDFFREEEHFDCLARTMVPSLLAARRHAASPLLKVWSAASSNGAEAYSIAMQLDDLRFKLGDFRFAILGTDICTEMLDQGARAIYPEDVAGPIPAEMRRRYLMWSRHESGRREFRIVPELRRTVRFDRLNLMDESYPFDRDVDIIFLRNVLIYFDRPTQEAVLMRLIGHLRPGGYLVLGHSESMIGTNLNLRPVVPAVFQNV